MARQSSLLALTCLAFFMADVRDGLGPFLATYLQGSHVPQEVIGATMTAGGLAAVVMTPLAGVWVDSSQAKRAMMAVAAIAVTAASAMAFGTFSVALLIASQIITGIAGAMMGAAMAALTLGLSHASGFKRQTGRFNTALGFVMTLQGVGAAFSPSVANWVVGSQLRFGTAFVVLSAAAILALPLFWLAQRDSKVSPSMTMRST